MRGRRCRWGGRDGADDRDHDQLQGGHPQRVLRLGPGAEPDDVQGDHRRHQDQGLAVADRQAAQRQHRKAGDRHEHGHPRQAADPRVQQERGEDRRRHDIHPGDEARDGGRRLRQSCGLQDLGDAVEAPEDDGLAPRLAAEPAQRAGGQEDHRRARDREPDGEEVERRHPGQQVVDQEERRAPARGDAQERCGREQGGTTGREHLGTLPGVQARAGRAVRRGGGR